MKPEHTIKEFLSSASGRRLACICFFFLAAFFFFAISSDWIYDESTSYYGVLNNSVWGLLTYNKFKLANSHVINSLYFRLLQHGHFTDVVYYRLLSLAGFVLFFIANSKILKLLKINSFYIIFLIITPYLFYFAYGRGYALAMGSFAMCFYYLLRYSKEQRIKYEYLIVLFGTLSSLSVFSFVYGFLAILVVFGIFKLRHLKSIHTFILAFFVLGVLVYIYTMGKIVNANDPFIIGINQFSLYKYGTISSIFSDFSYRDFLMLLFFNNAGFFKLVTWFKLLITVCIMAPMFYVRKTSFRKFDPANIKTILILLIVLPFLFMIAANVFTHALYPLTRAVFFLHYSILLFVLVSTVSYSGKIMWYIPLIIIFITSLTYGCYTYIDLSRPDIKEALVTTKSYPLYVLFENDKTVRLINTLSGINKRNITEGHSTPNIIPLVKADTSNIRYIICWPAYKDSCLAYFKNTTVYKYRNGNSLIEIRR